MVDALVVKLHWRLAHACSARIRVIGCGLVISKSAEADILCTAVLFLQATRNKQHILGCKLHCFVTNLFCIYALVRIPTSRLRTHAMFRNTATQALFDWAKWTWRTDINHTMVEHHILWKIDKHEWFNWHESRDCWSWIQWLDANNYESCDCSEKKKLSKVWCSDKFSSKRPLKSFKVNLAVRVEQQLRLLQNKQGQTAKKKEEKLSHCQYAKPEICQCCCQRYTAEALCWPFSKTHVRNKLTWPHTKHLPSAPQSEQRCFFCCRYEIKHRSSQRLKIVPLDLLDISLICDDTVVPSIIPAVYQVIKFWCQAVWVG